MPETDRKYKLLRDKEDGVGGGLIRFPVGTENILSYDWEFSRIDKGHQFIESGSLRNPVRITIKKTIFGHITVKLQNTKDKKIRGWQKISSKKH